MEKSLNYILNDVDGNFYGNINGISSYSLKLNYDNSFEKQYNLIPSSEHEVLTFFF